MQIKERVQMKKRRIIRRTFKLVNGGEHHLYVIQEKHWIFRWLWTDMSCNYAEYVQDNFSTMKEAFESIGSEVKDTNETNEWKNYV